SSLTPHPSPLIPHPSQLQEILMGFIMDGIEAEGYDRNYTDGQLLRRIGGYFRSHLGQVGAISSLILLNSLMDLVLPVLIAEAVDNVVGVEGSAAINQLIFFILGATILSWVFNFMRQRLTARTVGDV